MIESFVKTLRVTRFELTIKVAQFCSEEMYETRREQGAFQYEKSSSSAKAEEGEKGGAAVIPLCLPLCCAAPCVIM